MAAGAGEQVAGKVIDQVNGTEQGTGAAASRGRGSDRAPNKAGQYGHRTGQMVSCWHQSRHICSSYSSRHLPLLH